MPYPNQYFQPYQTNYQPTVPAPMDRLSQMQAQQYQMQQTQQPPQTNQGLLWVQGEAGAKSYLVAPNTTVLLMDSEGSRFYLKSTDNAGMPSLRVFEYSEVFQNTPQAQNSAQNDLDDKYVTREEYNALQGKYAEILDRLDNFSVPDADSDTARRTEKASGNVRNKGGTSNE